MICLPKNVAALLSLAAKDSGRFAMTGVRVEEKRGNHYRLVATDGKRLAVVQGPSPVELPPEPSRPFEYMVPADVLGQGFKDIPKPERYGPRRPQALALRCEENTVTLEAGAARRQSRVMDGRFPDYGLVLPKGPPLAVVWVDPDLLASLLKAAGAIAVGPDGSDQNKVGLAFYKSGAPMGVLAANSGGQTFDGLIMPLTHDDPPKATAVKEEPDDEEDEDEEPEEDEYEGDDEEPEDEE